MFELIPERNDPHEGTPETEKSLRVFNSSQLWASSGAGPV